jgi:alpha-beta hydrolase superfamily lysophospholipase
LLQTKGAVYSAEIQGFIKPIPNEFSGERMEHREGIFQGVDGIELYWQSWRPESGFRATIGIIHGFGEHSGRYASLASHFVSQGYAVYGFDLRGHGRSPGQRGHINSWDEYRGDVKGFLGLICNREPGRAVFLWGHSMGALIALDYLLRGPAGLCGAVISGAPLEPVGVAKPLLVLIARVLSRIWPHFSLPLGISPKALSRDPEAVKAYEADPLVHGKTTVRWGTEVLRTIERVKVHAAEVHIPLMLIHGGADPLNSVKGTRSFFDKIVFPDKTMKIYPGSYHEVHNDLDRSQVMEDAAQWLRGHIPEAQGGPNWDRLEK